MEVTTRKITKSEAKKLYNELIPKDTDATANEKIMTLIKYNILNILNNLGSIFTDLYQQYKNVPKETMFERSIAERINQEKTGLMKLKEKNRT